MKASTKTKDSFYLYIINSVEKRAYKIGISLNPEKRIQKFGINAEIVLKVHGGLEQVKKLESQVHACLSEYRLPHVEHKGSGNSEWFAAISMPIALKFISKNKF